MMQQKGKKFTYLPKIKISDQLIQRNCSAKVYACLCIIQFYKNPLFQKSIGNCGHTMVSCHKHMMPYDRFFVMVRMQHTMNCA